MSSFDLTHAPVATAFQPRTSASYRSSHTSYIPRSIQQWVPRFKTRPSLQIRSFGTREVQSACPAYTKSGIYCPLQKRAKPVVKSLLTVYIRRCVSTPAPLPPGPVFHPRSLDKQEGANTERCIRLRKHSAHSARRFPRRLFSQTIPFLPMWKPLSTANRLRGV